MGPAVLAIAIVIGVLGALSFRRRRLGSFKASATTGDGSTSVQLVAGPFSGKNVKIAGLPELGAELSSWTAGLVGSDIHRGHYVVTEVTPQQRIAVGSWQLDA
jgi:hypothetical protein